MKQTLSLRGNSCYATHGMLRVKINPQRWLRRQQCIALLIVVLFVAAAFSTLHAMPMGENGMMATCPLMGSPAAICQMNVAEHLSSWRALFAPVPETLAFILLLVVAGYSASVFYVNARPLLSNLIRSEQRTRNSSLSLFLPLRLALSRGILHPKLYSRTV